MIKIFDTHNKSEYEKIQEQIQDKRCELYKLVCKKGLNSLEVVKCSQELDFLLNILEK